MPRRNRGQSYAISLTECWWTASRNKKPRRLPHLPPTQLLWAAIASYIPGAYNSNLRPGAPNKQHTNTKTRRSNGQFEPGAIIFGSFGKSDSNTSGPGQALIFITTGQLPARTAHQMFAPPSCHLGIQFPALPVTPCARANVNGPCPSCFVFDQVR